MPDFDAIGVALAARYAPAQVTPPAGGYVNIRSSTGDLPDELGPLPCVVVIPDGGTFGAYSGSQRMGTHTWLVRFYFSEAIDIVRDSIALRKWLTVLVDQLKASVQLGGIVASARVMVWKAGLMKYAGRDYSGLELSVDIVTIEPWGATS